MEEYETIEKGKKILKIFYDEDPGNPREWDNLTKLCLSHKRYNFENALNIDFDKFNNWDEIKEYLIKEYDAILIKPISMYDHGGIVLHLDSVLSGWDSGQLGFIFVTKEDFLKEYGKVTKKTIKKAEDLLKAEFETYKNYVEGEVFGYILYEKVKVKIIKEYENGEKIKTKETELKEIDSCWGFYGDEGINQIKMEVGFYNFK